MLELARHIERLVLRNNCVIVPGLGGFVTQYVPARYVEEENILLPPCRTVGFNPQLTLNDGLLVQSYMQTYDTSFPEAARIVEDEVKLSPIPPAGTGQKSGFAKSVNQEQGTKTIR